MKITLSITLVFLFHLNAFTQPVWEELPIENSVWTQYSASWWQGELIMENTYFYSYGGDTSINDMVYQKIIQNNEPDFYIGAIRQEEKLVYYIPDGQNTESTLYNFDIEPGTIIHRVEEYYDQDWCNEYLCAYIKLMDIQTHNTNAGERDHYTFGLYYEDYDGQEQFEQEIFQWIEGLGSTTGLFTPFENFYDQFYIIADGENYTGLLCMTTDDQFIYAGEYYEGECNYVTSNHEVPLDKEAFISYPNPVTDILNINYEHHGALRFPLQVEVYNASGQLVGHKQLPQLNASQSFELNFHDYAKGLYFIKITNEKESSLQKVIKL